MGEAGTLETSETTQSIIMTIISEMKQKYKYPFLSARYKYDQVAKLHQDSKLHQAAEFYRKTLKEIRVQLRVELLDHQRDNASVVVWELWKNHPVKPEGYIVWRTTDEPTANEWVHRQSENENYWSATTTLGELTFEQLAELFDVEPKETAADFLTV